MKSTKTITKLRRYTTRMNLIFSFGFILSFMWAYTDYQVKLQNHPNLPMIGMFFKVKSNTWDQASAFTK